jgi:hypothetical protein
MILEIQQPGFYLGEVGEVCGSEHLALHHREVDLVEPRSVYRQVDQDQVGEGASQSIDGGLPAMTTAVVHDSEHPVGGGVGLRGHDPLNETMKLHWPNRVVGTVQ